MLGANILWANLCLLATVKSRVDHDLEEKRQEAKLQGQPINLVKLTKLRVESIQILQIFSGIYLVVGAAFHGFGSVIYAKPIRVTVLGLVLYLMAWLIRERLKEHRGKWISTASSPWPPVSRLQFGHGDEAVEIWRGWRGRQGGASIRSRR